MAGNSESNKRGAATRKEKDANAFKKMGARGGSAKKRGYLGLLKDQGRTEELRAITSKGAKAANAIRSQRKSQNEGTESGPEPAVLDERA